MTERNAYTGRFRKEGAAPTGKLSPEAEAEIERLWQENCVELKGPPMDWWAMTAKQGPDALRAAMVWAYRDAAAICRSIADGPEYGADGEMFKEDDDPTALACADMIEARICVKP